MKVLVPLDGSKFAEAACERVAKILTETKAEVHFLSVVSKESAHTTWVRDYTPEGAARSYYDAFGVMHSRLVEGPAQPEMVETRDEALDRKVQRAEDYLSNLARKFQDQKAKTKVIVGEHVAEEIQSYAGREGIDLIALATHGRTGLAHIIMGSVAMELLRKGDTPLLLVRPKDLNS